MNKRESIWRFGTQEADFKKMKFTKKRFSEIKVKVVKEFTINPR